MDRAYGKDVSRLLDISRQQIVFECVEDITVCIETIFADPNVCVVKVRTYPSTCTSVGPGTCASLGLQLVMECIAIAFNQGHLGKHSNGIPDGMQLVMECNLVLILASPLLG